MKITVTTTNQTLDNILSADQKAAINKNAYATDNRWTYSVKFMNLWTDDIYIDFGTASSVDTWYKIAAWSEFETKAIQFNKINLISDTNNNTNEFRHWT